MKLIILLSITEHQEEAAALLHNAGIRRFSTAPIAGYKKKETTDVLNWFSPSSREVKTNSVVLFSFATEEAASQVLEEVNRCNRTSRPSFPLHAFIVDVTQYSDFF